MGFIEDLRRQKEISEQISRERASETKEEREKKKKARVKEGRDRAERHYLSSAFPKLIEGLVELDGWSKTLSYGETMLTLQKVQIELKKKISRDLSFEYQLRYGTRYSKEIEIRRIDIIIVEHGELRVEGDEKRGSTSLYLPNCTLERQEKALRNAWIFPKKHVFGDSSTHRGDPYSSYSGGLGSSPSQPH